MTAVEYQIGGGAVVLIDEEDLEHIGRFKWSPRKHPKTTYAQANAWFDDKRGTLVMHRFIARALPSEHVDHENGDGLDNRKANLRVCQRFQNNRNARKRVDNSSGYKGVSWYPAGNKWSVGIMLDGKKRHVGYFDDLLDAVDAYDDVAQYAWGEFAWLNQPSRRASPEVLELRIQRLLAGRKGYLPELWCS